jgi:hypothetical protein
MLALLRLTGRRLQQSEREQNKSLHPILLFFLKSSAPARHRDGAD